MSSGSATRPHDVRVIGTPSAASDAAVARWFERWLERQHPGTVWRVRERLEDRRSLEPAPGKVGGSTASGVDDDAGRVAA